MTRESQYRLELKIMILVIMTSIQTYATDIIVPEMAILVPFQLVNNKKIIFVHRYFFKDSLMITLALQFGNVST